MFKAIKNFFVWVFGHKRKVLQTLIEIAGIIVTPGTTAIIRWYKLIMIALKVKSLRRNTMSNEDGVIGTKETEQVAEFLISLVNALSDGIQIGDSTVLLAVPEVLAGITLVPSEIADMDETELRDNILPIVQKLELPDKDVEYAIEYLVMAVLGFGRLFMLKAGNKQG